MPINNSKQLPAIMKDMANSHQLTTKILVPTLNADSIWINNINIIAPSPDSPIRINITVSPYDSTNVIVLNNNAQRILIDDALNEIPDIMNSLYLYVNDYINNNNLFGQSDPSTSEIPVSNPSAPEQPVSDPSAPEQPVSDPLTSL